MIIEKNQMKLANWTFGNLPDLEPLELSDDNPLRFKKQTLFAGTHRNSNGKEFTVDEDDLNHWVETGNEMVAAGINIPLPADHNENEPDRGIITRFEKATDSKGRVSLYLSGVARDKGVIEELKTTDISLYSPTIHKAKGKYWARPILHACTTKQPMIKGLEGFQLVLSYDGMDDQPTDLKQRIGELLEAGYTKEDITAALGEADGETCAECEKRDAHNGHRQLLALSADVDVAALELSRRTGERVAVVPQDKGTLILALSELKDEQPTHVVGV